MPRILLVVIVVRGQRIVVDRQMLLKDRSCIATSVWLARMLTTSQQTRCMAKMPCTVELWLGTRHVDVWHVDDHSVAQRYTTWLPPECLLFETLFLRNIAVDCRLRFAR